MNYLIINGQKSLSIQGLLIQSLPPISKPMMRAQIDEIDGRDGDIITPLGFKAYDRPVEIGLTRFYDIDEVIGFFNQSGEIIFSNEPYKVYKFDILEQIDFERLIRFRTATVNVHVQPFKHSTVEFPLEYSSNLDALAVINNGNIDARPKIEIYGTGNIDFSINDTDVLSIELGNEGNITIDAEQMEAYNSGGLKNRLVVGNYDKIILERGKNILGFDGNVSKVVISQYSRWI
jgi:phage-related protein